MAARGAYVWADPWALAQLWRIGPLDASLVLASGLLRRDRRGRVWVSLTADRAAVMEVVAAARAAEKLLDL